MRNSRIIHQIFVLFFVLFYCRNSLHYQLKATELELKNKNIFPVDSKNNKDFVIPYNDTFLTHNTTKTPKDNSNSSINNQIAFFSKYGFDSRKLVIQNVRNINETESLNSYINNESIQNLKITEDGISSCAPSIFDLPKLYAEALEAINADNIDQKENKKIENLLSISKLEFMLKLDRNKFNDSNNDNLLLSQFEAFKHKILTIKTVTQICITQLNINKQTSNYEVLKNDLDIEECTNMNSKNETKHNKNENEKKVKIAEKKYLSLLITFKFTNDIIIIGTDKLYIQHSWIEKGALNYVILQAHKSDDQKISSEEKQNDDYNNNGNVAVYDERRVQESDNLQIKLHFKEDGKNYKACKITQSITFNAFLYTLSPITIDESLEREKKDKQEIVKEIMLYYLNNSNAEKNEDNRFLQTRFGSTGAGYSTGIFFNRNDMNSINNLTAENLIKTMTLSTNCFNTRYVCQINGKTGRNGVLMGGSKTDKNYIKR